MTGESLIAVATAIREKREEAHQELVSERRVAMAGQDPDRTGVVASGDRRWCKGRSLAALQLGRVPKCPAVALNASSRARVRQPTRNETTTLSARRPSTGPAPPGARPTVNHPAWAQDGPKA